MSHTHSFTEFRKGSCYSTATFSADGSRQVVPLGDGTAVCENCGVTLPTVDGKIIPGWVEGVHDFDCLAALVDSVHTR